MSFWFGIKAIPDGTPVASGPYQSVELANAERRKMKGIHTEISTWFAAENEKQADAKAKWQLEGGIYREPE